MPPVRYLPRMCDQGGLALPLALISLLILTTLVLTVLNLGAVEPQISRNLSDSARARHLAEAGIEWAFDCIANQDLDAFLAGPDNIQNTADDQLATSVAGQNIGAQMGNNVCVNSPAPGALPGLTSAMGTFAVTIRNDSIAAGGGYAGDQVLTGVPVDGGGKFSDTNGIVILTATGTYGTATRQITAVISRNTLAINAAVALSGFQADTYIQTVGNQTIDGRDWMRADDNSLSAPNGSTMRLGIATQPGTQANLGITYEQNVENAFDTVAKQDTVQGKSQVNGAATSGFDTISADNTMTPSAVQSFLNKLAANPATRVIQSSMVLAGPGQTGAAETPPGVEYLYVESNEGGSSGGHVALRVGDDVFHFEHRSPGILVLGRDDFEHFRYRYSVLENRTIHVSRLAVSGETAGLLADRFGRRRFLQRRHLDVIESLRADRTTLEEMLSDGIVVEAAGYFFSDHAVPEPRDAGHAQAGPRDGHALRQYGRNVRPAEAARPPRLSGRSRHGGRRAPARLGPG